MAYDRDEFLSRRGGRDRDYSREDYRGGGPRAWDRGGRDEDRGWFERAGEQIASWFGDDDDDRRSEYGAGRREHMSGRREPWGGGRFERDHDRNQGSSRDRGYRPMAGDYGRSEPMSVRGSGSERGGFGRGFEERQRPQGFESSAQGIHDPHYHSWRQRQIEELDRDYDEYRRENQARFESEFGSWRERRTSKRSMLGTVREHMQVVGNDDEPVGTVDRVAGDRIILTKSDPEAGGSHHSISCGTIDRIEENRVILDCSAKQARQNWRDDDRERSLSEREDQGEVGPHILNRSFEGTYR